MSCDAQKIPMIAHFEGSSVSAVIPRIEFSYSPPIERSQLFRTTVFKDWHRAKLLGMELTSLTIDGRVVAQRALARVNFFIEGQGAWRCSSLPYWDAFAALEMAVRRDLDVPVGPAGAGRWTTAF